MADITYVKNIGAEIDVVRAGAAASLTAGASTATTTGATIDRKGYGGSMPRSVLASIIFDATLATGKTLSVAYAFQHSPDASSWTDYATATYVAVATGATAASVAAGEFNVQVDLANAYRYIRFNTTMALSATQTDTSVSRGVLALGGFDRLAAPNT